jgi:hypothetical protein
MCSLSGSDADGAGTPRHVPGAPWRLQFIIRTRHRDILRTIKPAGAKNQLPKLNNKGMAR